MQGARRTAPRLSKLFVLQSDPSFLHNHSAYVYPDHRFFFKIARADSNAQSHLFHFRPCIHLLRPVSYSGCVFRGEARIAPNPVRRGKPSGSSIEKLFKFSKKVLDRLVAGR